MEQLEQRVETLIEEAPCMLYHIYRQGGLSHCEGDAPPRERKGFREIWFSTNTSSQKVRAFREDPKASVYFMDRSRFQVSLAGTVEVLETPEAKERLWREGDQLYYKRGVTDP